MNFSYWNVLLTAALLLGCGDDGEKRVVVVGEVPATPELDPLELVGSASCELDGDCDLGMSCFQGACALECVSAADCLSSESCSSRGRCMPLQNGNGAARIIGNQYLSVIPGLSIARLPERVQYVSGTQPTIDIELEIAGDVPSDGLAWRSERTDGLAGSGNIKRTKGKAGRYVLTVPIGAADPAGDNEIVKLSLITTAGAVRVELVPELEHAGAYAGVASIELFGQAGLPLELSLSVSGTTLDLSEPAEIILEVSEGHFFSPISPTGTDITHVTASLVYDDFVAAWVAQFNNEYQVADGGVLGFASGSRVTRSMRIELNVLERGVMIGRISDRWSGLSQEKTFGGVLLPTDVEVSGDFQLQRVDSTPLLVNFIGTANGVDAFALPEPQVEEFCTSAMVASAMPQMIDGVSYDCDGLFGLFDFETSLPAKQMRCGISVASTALAAGSTSEEIANFLDPEYVDAQSRSFSEFMADCAQGINGTCVPSSEILCSRSLLAIGMMAGIGNETLLNQALIQYRAAASEAFLGRQFAAFDNDTKTRLTWLQTQDYPAIVTSAVKSLVTGLMDEWQVSVLDVHMQVLAGHMDASGLAVLSQQVGGDALVSKQSLLLEVTQSWQGAMNALALASSRWNTLLDDSVEREAKSALIGAQAFDLYLSAIVLANLNLKSGAGVNNASLGGGFSALVHNTRKLARPYDKLLFERAGEVVVSTSLDPAAGNATILASLQAKTNSGISAAASSVNAVIADAQAQALGGQRLQDQMNNDISGLRDELVELCGLPIGCSLADYGNLPECEVQAIPGRCGFGWDGDARGVVEDTSMLATSAAGSAILEIRQAGLSSEGAFETARAQAEKTSFYAQAADVFAAYIEKWRLSRVASFKAMQENFDSIEASHAGLLAGIQLYELGQLAEYRELLDDQAKDIEQWAEVSYGGINTHVTELAWINRLNITAGAIVDNAERIVETGKAIADGFPKSIGTSTDATSMARMSARLSAISAAAIVKAGGKALQATAKSLVNKANQKKELAAVEAKELLLVSALGAEQHKADLAALKIGIDDLKGINASEVEKLENILTLMQEQVANAEAHERDMLALRDRRDTLKRMLVDSEGLQIQILQAELTIEQRVAEYLRLAQKAQLLQGRLTTLENQRSNINQIVGSPAMIFSWANRLGQAELRLDNAKDRMMDWVVALEYYAVRPFMDQRIQILLARNTFQLEAIAGELERIQSSCGGAVNNQRVDISLRDDAARYTTSTVDNANDGAVHTPAKRFRAVLEAANMPVDKRIRYSSDATIGDLVSRGDVLAMTFELSIDEFANVANTCNAKLVGLSVQLVGENLGSALPTVSILYDGTSLLRSCQPDITSIAETLGPQATVFNEITEFKTPGRSISPIATINAFDPSQEPNITLGGLPLVSQYTVLIDRSTGQNAQINWDNLEDIRLQIDYSFQDLFPAGQCQ